MTFRAIPRHAIKIDLPNTTQVEDYTCGPSALLGVCAYYGVGPQWEDEVADDMAATEDGTDPIQLVQAATKYGLRTKEYRGMTDAQLRRCLDKRRPVILMLQAWADVEVPPASYAADWANGHWVVAIGYDKRHVYFEDPSLHGARGFLTFADLDDRWHDIEGPTAVHVTRYGLAVWKKGASKSAYARRARRID